MTNSETILKTEADMKAIAGKKTAFYSGSFNPPHLGHMAIIEWGLKNGFEQVIVFPHSHNKNKEGILADIDDRIEMLEILIEESPHRSSIHICHPNLYHGIPRTETGLFTICSLLTDESNPSHAHPTILIGQDSVTPNYSLPLKQLTHYVCRREGYGDHNYSGFAAIHQFQVASSCSSTRFRTGDDQARKDHVGKRVFQYVRQKGLYQDAVMPLIGLQAVVSW